MSEYEAAMQPGEADRKEDAAMAENPEASGTDANMIDCLSRPTEELSLPRSTQVAGVKVSSRSLAASADKDGSSGASTATAAVVPAT